MVRVLIHTDSRYPVNRKVVRGAVMDAFHQNKMGNIDAEISIAVIGQRKMKQICQKYLGEEKVCEVLAFPLEDEGARGSRGFINFPDGILRLGDIILCWPQVLSAASRDELMVDSELAFLVNHGALHLIGKHHE